MPCISIAYGYGNIHNDKLCKQTLDTHARQSCKGSTWHTCTNLHKYEEGIFFLQQTILFWFCINDNKYCMKGSKGIGFGLAYFFKCMATEYGGKPFMRGNFCIGGSLIIASTNRGTITPNVDYVICPTSPYLVHISMCLEHQMCAPISCTLWPYNKTM